MLVPTDMRHHFLSVFHCNYVSIYRPTVSDILSAIKALTRIFFGGFSGWKQRGPKGPGGDAVLGRSIELAKGLEECCELSKWGPEHRRDRN